jgi:hypothetical protein
MVFAVEIDRFGVAEAIAGGAVTVQSVFEDLRREVLDAHLQRVEIAIDQPHAVGEVATVFGPLERGSGFQDGESLWVTLALIEIKSKAAFVGPGANAAEEIGVAVVVPIQRLVARIVVVDRLVLEREAL